MVNVVEVTFQVPISSDLMVKVIDNEHWLRLSDRVVLMAKNEWLEVKDTLQPHTVKGLELLCTP